MISTLTTSPSSIAPPLVATESRFVTLGAERSIVYGPPVATAPQLPALSTAQTWKYQLPPASGGEVVERSSTSLSIVKSQSWSTPLQKKL